MIDLKKAQMKIREMEECLKSMNDENDNLKGKLGNVINNLSTSQDHHRSESNINNNSNYENIRKKVVKKKNFSTLSDNATFEDLRNKLKNPSNNDINNYNNKAQFISHYKTNSIIGNNSNEEDEENNLSEEANFGEPNEYAKNINCNIGPNFNSYQNDVANKIHNNNKNINQVHTDIKLRNRELSNNMIKWNRNLTLGKSSQNNVVASSADISPNNMDENHFGMQSNSSNNNLNENSNINKIYNMNPFVDNTSTFINNDFENIHEKISNLGNMENIDNVNNLEEIEQMENEDDSNENYNVVGFPLQLKMKNKKKR